MLFQFGLKYQTLFNYNVANRVWLRWIFKFVVSLCLFCLRILFLWPHKLLIGNLNCGVDGERIVKDSLQQVAMVGSQQKFKRVGGSVGRDFIHPPWLRHYAHEDRWSWCSKIALEPTTVMAGSRESFHHFCGKRFYDFSKIYQRNPDALIFTLFIFFFSYWNSWCHRGIHCDCNISHM